MAVDPESPAAGRLSRARRSLARLNAFLDRATFRIAAADPAHAVAELDRRWRLKPAERERLAGLAAGKAGAAFIRENVAALNRSAFHRSAFLLNAVVHLLFVDLAGSFGLSLPQLKLALVGGNLLLALVAHREIGYRRRLLLAGPGALPARRRMWGLRGNPRYNRAVKRRSRPHARSAWREASLYRPAYFLNAATVFFGAQFVVPPGALVFPLGFLANRVTGLLATLVAVFDVWRGIRAGDDARRDREKEVSTYKDLDI
jgi:hypothetical protein